MHHIASNSNFRKSLKFLFKSSEMGFTGCVKYLEKIIAHLRQSFTDMPDKRTGRNCQYSLGDIGMSAFSVFFMQQPSFLAFQRTLHSNVGKDNTQTLFGMDKIPTDNHIRKILDDIDPGQLDENFFFLLDEIEAAGGKVGGASLGSHTLIALDGSEYFCSKKLNTPPAKAGGFTLATKVAFRLKPVCPLLKQAEVIPSQFGRFHLHPPVARCIA